MHSAIKNTLVSELQKGKMLLYLMSQTVHGDWHAEAELGIIGSLKGLFRHAA